MKARILAAISAAAVAVPLAAVTSAPALASTTHELTVKVIDRAGHAGASTHVQLVNLASGTDIHLGTTRQRSLRADTYNIAAWIITGSGASATYTLADKIVDLNASKTVVLDARQGKLVRLHLSNASAVAETLEVAPIVNGSDWAFNPTTIYPPVGKTYLVPMR